MERGSRSDNTMYIETIINRWFNDEKNLKILNGIVRHWSDKQIARENNIRIDAVANYRSKLKKKRLLTAGFFSINHEKLGLAQLMDFPRERPSPNDTFLVRLVRISRPYGYLRVRLLPAGTKSHRFLSVRREGAHDCGVRCCSSVTGGLRWRRGRAPFVEFAERV